MIQAGTHHSAIIVQVTAVTLAILLTQLMNIFVKLRKCQLPTYYLIEAKQGPRQRVELNTV